MVNSNIKQFKACAFLLLFISLLTSALLFYISLYYPYLRISFVNDWASYPASITHNTTTNGWREAHDMMSEQIHKVINKTLNRKTPRNDSESGFYLIANSKGRLGNQMNIYAALYGAHVLYPDRIVCLGIGYGILRETFPNLSMPQLAACQHRKDLLKQEEDILNLGVALKFIQKLPNYHVRIVGFFESFWFFNHAKDHIRREFQLSDAVTKKVSEFFEKVTPPEWLHENFTRVGIHVRRGDRLDEKWVNKGYIEAPQSYFLKSMDYFSTRHAKVQFIVASDDMAWCRDNIKADNIVYTSERYIMDFAILTLCDHIIMTFGSFSWWAGWLNKGTTIYYGKFPTPSTWTALHYNRADYYPPDDQSNHWIPMM